MNTFTGRRCETCRSRQFHVGEDGFTYCSKGHRQEAGLVEGADEFMGVGNNAKKGKAKAREKSSRCKCSSSSFYCTTLAAPTMMALCHQHPLHFHSSRYRPLLFTSSLALVICEIAPTAPTTRVHSLPITLYTFNHRDISLSLSRLLSRPSPPQ